MIEQLDSIDLGLKRRVVMRLTEDRDGTIVGID